MAENTNSLSKEPKTVTDKEPEKVTDKTPETVTDEATVISVKSSNWSVSLLYVLLFVFISVTVAGAYTLWQQQLKITKAQLAQQDQYSGLQQQIQQLSNSTQALNQPIESNRQQIEDLKLQQQQLADVSSRAIEITKRNQREWILAEIDYLLQIANRRLQISRDINSSIAALDAASSRILELGDMHLFPVRKQLAIDIGKLKSLQQVDINGTALAIDQMIIHLNELPFKTAQDEVKTQFENQDTKAIQTEVTSGDKNMVDSVLDTLMKIGDVKIHHRSIQPASSSQQQQQIEQLLQTHLLSARLSILRYDQAQFSHDIDITRQLLHLHYKADDNRVTQMLSDLDSFSTLVLNPDLPDITTAWSMLHKPSANKTEAQK